MLVVLSSLTVFIACNDENIERVNGGKPFVKYVRINDPNASDSLITSAYLGNKIALIGDNLASVREIYFNDQKAKLNPTYVTQNAIIVDVPQGIPSLKEDRIYLITSHDTVIYNFETKVPAPAVNSMDFEYVAEGDIAYIHGLYFVNDAGTPLKVTFNDDVEAEIISQDVNNIAVRVPAGAQPGPVTVISVYGETESAFWWHDNRNIILTFNNGISLAYDYYSGWHGATGVSSDGGINGNYLIMGDGTLEMTDDTWNDSKFGFEVWTYLPADPDFFDVSNIDKYVLKFEVKYTNWSAAALQVVFTGASDVMLNWENGNGLTHDSRWDVANGYISDSAYPRMLYIPWKDGGLTSSDWITVTIPMSDCKYNANGEAVAPQGTGHYSGITLFVNSGGVAGTPCTPIIWLDNVRIVPK
ncbi:MAG: glycan-binding surface protein [Prevotellaceae bacterium]|nr:glycan-binding surface protein [Prevotellaceae bacterium]